MLRRSSLVECVTRNVFTKRRLPGPPQTNWTRIVSERGLVNISVIETDTATSGLRWIFHMHSDFSRPAMSNNAIMIISSTSKYKYRVSLRRIGQEYSAKVAFSIFQSLKRIHSLPVRSKLI
jgi:hypothetical protein